MFGSIQVAQQRDLGAVVQHLLVDPPLAASVTTTRLGRAELRSGPVRR
jgi:hypothetical protein